MSFLTLEEAKIYSGKSESTLRRFIKKTLTSKKKSEYIKKKKLPNGGYQYLIDIRLLEKKYDITSHDNNEDEKQSDKKNELGISKKQESKEVEVLHKYIESLEKQLAVKDKQIFELLAQDRENHALLEKINEALIKFRIPEYIETQVIQESSSSKNEEEKPSKTEDENHEKIKEGSFYDWIKKMNP